MATRQSSISEAELPKLQQKAVISWISTGEPARQDKQKVKVEFREGLQHSAQGPRDCAVGKLR